MPPFLIIWGTTGRESMVGQGQFYCPECDGPQQFHHNRVSRYFTLYFIPLFPIGTVGEYIHCGGCHSHFTPEVLNYKPPSPGQRIAMSIGEDLAAGMPLHMAQQKLVTAGNDQQTAQQIVSAAAGPSLAFCQKCNFYYKNTVRACSNCGGPLAPYQG